MTRPGMLHGVVLRPPSFGARLVSIDLSAAEAKDVTAVRDGDFVGFAAPTSASARAARDAASGTARWEEEAAHPSSDDLADHLRESARRGGRRRGDGSREEVEKALGDAQNALRATYRIAYVQHAPMEPRAAVAEWEDGRLTVWTGTQNPSRVRSQLSEAFRASREKVRVVVPDTGGGFGGKHTGEVAIEAARLAKESGRPVSVRWTREEELTWAYFRPAGVIELAGGLDGTGKLVAWKHTNYNSGGSAIESPYRAPAESIGFLRCDAPLRQGAYRGLAATANVFARECFLDELAAAAGADPLEIRQRHIEDERLRAVLDAAAERFGWADRREAAASAAGRGVGIACGTEKGSYVAACAEVEVDPKRGVFRVLEISQAFECGAVVNPRNLRAQVEGCIVQGLGGALREEILFRDGRVTNATFSRYRVPRFRDVPKIETVLLDRPDRDPAGAGETPIVAVAPAVGNAIFAASGERIRALPLRSETLRSV